jgi:hypothetical protein
VEDMRVERVTPPGRFAVARYRPVPEGVACHVVRTGDDEVSEVLLRGLDSPLLPGCFEVEAGPPSRAPGRLRWQITLRAAASWQAPVGQTVEKTRPRVLNAI